MFDYDAERLRDIILEITRSNISPEAWTWFQDRLQIKDTSAINSTFSLIPRKTGKDPIIIRATDSETITQMKTGYSLLGWTADRITRVCFLMHLDPSDKDDYFRTIESLFLAAEMSELVALYSSLPLLAYPDDWKMRCAEGIRSNIAVVLEAIMYHNPYPAEHLDDKAWNQLVMKAFFTDKDVNQIYGLDDRANAELTLILSDYAHERWAAGRSVNPLLWRSTAKFIDARILNDLKKVLSEGDWEEKRAVALTISSSNSNEAKELLMNYKELVSSFENKDLSWDHL
jgi:hypothetical protein